MARFCKNCGTIMSNDEKICPRCGSSSRSRKPTSSIERKGMLMGRLVSLAVALVVIVLGLIYFSMLR